MPTIKFGSNSFTADRDFTIIGLNDKGGLIFGGFGPPPKTPLLWVTFKNNGAFLNADIADSEGESVLQIRDNVITLNKDNVYSVEQRPENRIPPDQIIVTNRDGETAMDLRRDGAIWDFNGDIYCGQLHIVATPRGTEVNPAAPRVG